MADACCCCCSRWLSSLACPGLTCFLLSTASERGKEIMLLLGGGGGGGVVLSNHSSTASYGKDGLVEGADTYGQRSNFDKVGCTHPPGKHLLDRDSLGLEKIGGRRPGLLGHWGGWWGKAPNSPGLQSITCSSPWVVVQYVLGAPYELAVTLK